MLDADIQNSSRLVKLYKHLPEKDLVDANILMTYENVLKYNSPTQANIEAFDRRLRAVKELDDDAIFDILNGLHGSDLKQLLSGIAEQMHVYIALREHVVDENIHWLV